LTIFLTKHVIIEVISTHFVEAVLGKNKEVWIAQSEQLLPLSFFRWVKPEDITFKTDRTLRNAPALHFYA
jgi:hypothetical protein